MTRMGRSLKVACPVCGAKPYRLCTDGAYVVVPHTERIFAWGGRSAIGPDAEDDRP